MNNYSCISYIPILTLFISFCSLIALVTAWCTILAEIGDKNPCLIPDLITVDQIEQVPFYSWLNDNFKIINGN